MLRKSHIIVSEAIVSAICLKMHVTPQVAVCVMAATSVGVQLPDIDHPRSRINRSLGFFGRFLAKHMKHRTWTHTAWAVLLMIALAIFAPAPSFNHAIPIYMSGHYGQVISILRLLYYGLAGGYFLHVLEDSFSNQGVCWTYPFTKFSYYMGKPYKRGHRHWWTYATGGKEETFIRVISFLVLLLICLQMILVTA